MMVRLDMKMIGGLEGYYAMFAFDQQTGRAVVRNRIEDIQFRIRGQRCGRPLSQQSIVGRSWLNDRWLGSGIVMTSGLEEDNKQSRPDDEEAAPQA
jgi:hypothetical protein